MVIRGLALTSLMMGICDVQSFNLYSTFPSSTSGISLGIRVSSPPVIALRCGDEAGGVATRLFQGEGARGLSDTSSPNIDEILSITQIIELIDGVLAGSCIRPVFG